MLLALVSLSRYTCPEGGIFRNKRYIKGSHQQIWGWLQLYKVSTGLRAEQGSIHRILLVFLFLEDFTPHHRLKNQILFRNLLLLDAKINFQGPVVISNFGWKNMTSVLCVLLQPLHLMHLIVVFPAIKQPLLLSKCKNFIKAHCDVKWNCFFVTDEDTKT